MYVLRSNLCVLNTHSHMHTRTHTHPTDPHTQRYPTPIPPIHTHTQKVLKGLERGLERNLKHQTINSYFWKEREKVGLWVTELLLLNFYYIYFRTVRIFYRVAALVASEM